MRRQETNAFRLNFSESKIIFFLSTFDLRQITTISTMTITHIQFLDFVVTLVNIHLLLSGKKRSSSCKLTNSANVRLLKTFGGPHNKTTLSLTFS